MTAYVEPTLEKNRKDNRCFRSRGDARGKLAGLRRSSAAGTPPRRAGDTQTGAGAAYAGAGAAYAAPSAQTRAASAQADAASAPAASCSASSRRH